MIAMANARQNVRKMKNLFDHWRCKQKLDNQRNSIIHL